MACLLPDLVEVCITNSGLLTNPSWLPIVHKGETYAPISFDISMFAGDNPALQDPKNDIVHVRDQFKSYEWKNKLLFSKRTDGEWNFDKNLLLDAKRQGLPLERANKIVHCQTLDDPIYG